MNISTSRPPTGSLHIFCESVYSFVICCPPLVVFRLSFSVLVPIWKPLWVPLCSRRSTLGRLGLPWGLPWSAYGHFKTWFDRFSAKLVVQFRAKGLQARCLRRKSGLLPPRICMRRSPGSPGSRISRGSGARAIAHCLFDPVPLMLC